MPMTCFALLRPAFNAFNFLPPPPPPPRFAYDIVHCVGYTLLRPRLVDWSAISCNPSVRTLVMSLQTSFATLTHVQPSSADVQWGRHSSGNHICIPQHTRQEPPTTLQWQELTSPMAASYPQFYGGSAQVPPQDADFEAWHGPVSVVPQQQQQQQQLGRLPAPGFQLPAPSSAAALGMPELPRPSGSQVRPITVLLGDATSR